MKKLLLTFLAVFGLFTTVATPIPTASAAGIYIVNYQYTGCLEPETHSAAGGKYVCYDAYFDRIYVINWTGPNTHTTQYDINVLGSLVTTDPFNLKPAPLPTVGYVTPDSECNAGAYHNGGSTYAIMGSSFGFAGHWMNYEPLWGSPPTVHTWYSMMVSTYDSNIIAYIVNSGLGYNCVYVPRGVN